MCGVEILFAVSAATTLAVEVAERCNLTLVGFCKPGRATVYTHPQRLIVQRSATSTAKVVAAETANRISTPHIAAFCTIS